MKTKPGEPDHRETIWGVRPESLPAIAATIRAGASGLLSQGAETGDVAGRIEAAMRAGMNAVTGGVAVIPLRGLITPRPSFISLLFGGGGGLIGFRDRLRDALASDEISAIVLDIDSPGGSTDLVTETAAEIRAARDVKPVIAVANTWAASAAYWLASQASELVVTASGEVGSIGVFSIHEDVSKLEEDLGIKTTLISAGKYKTEGNPYEPLSDEARAALQAKVDQYYDMFVNDVAKGRGVKASAVKSGYGEGRMIPAKQAVELGMADRIDSLEATIARIVTNPRRAGRRAQAEGTPESTPPENGGQETTARPTESYIDLMFDTAR